MTLEEFSNGLRILRSIDYAEIYNAGFKMTDRMWESFRDDPYFTFIKLDAANQRVIWTVIEGRMR
jgi:hypothetical protein